MPRSFGLALLLSGCLGSVPAGDGSPTPRGVDAGDDAADAPAGDPSADLRLNEVQCKGDEWIELVQAGAASADTAGWVVTDDPADPGRGYALPPGSRVGPGGLLVAAQESGRERGFAFGIGCGADTVTLLRPDGSEADSVAVPEPAPGDAWGRLPDATGAWVATEPSRGEPNRAARPLGADLFDPARVHRLELTLSAQALNRLRGDPYGYVEGALRLTPQDGAPGEWLEVGVRLKGRAGSLRDVDDKPAFKVDVNRVVPGQTLHGLTKLTLNNMVQDPSMLHEWLAYRLFREQGVPAPRVGYLWVELNGKPYGLYANVESYDKRSLGRRFDATTHLYEGMYGQDLFPEAIDELEADIGDPSDRGDLKTLARLAQEGDGFFAATDALIDWEEVIAAMATELFIGHWDGYAPTRNNYYLHFDGDGVCSLLPWGTDQTFAERLPLHWGHGLMLRLCLADADCARRYNAALATLADGLAGTDLAGEVYAQASLLRPWREQDRRRPYPEEASLTTIRHTIWFLERRVEDVAELMECLARPDGGDADGDGYACDADCDDSDPHTHPGARDLCGDRRDQDCNGRPDDAEDCPDCLPLDDDRYLVCFRGRPWGKARQVCQDRGRELGRSFDLVVLEDREEADWVRRAAAEVAPQPHWLGLTDREREGRFVWVDGTTPDGHGFAHWHEGEPNDSGEAGEDCAVFYAGDESARWNDVFCEEHAGAVCEAVAE